MKLLLVCFSNQLESFLQLFGLQEKLFFSGFQSKHLEHGISVSLSIFIVTMSSSKIDLLLVNCH